MKTKPVCIAYYLGQYHPIAENDSFWGAGFTEWHNVSKARPLYPGHAQPKLPGTFGFYDLRCEETLLEQMFFAKEIGITAFCYWHYWFAGKHMLHGPLDRMLSFPDHGVKFMLGWANESWSGIWHGMHDNILIEQTYNESELDEHAKVISSYIKTGRYLVVDGLYPMVIYKPRQIPKAAEYLGALKKAVRRYAGVGLYMIGDWSAGRSQIIARPADWGLDAVVVTPVAAYFRSEVAYLAYAAAWRLARKIGIGPEIRAYSSVTKTLEKAIKNVDGVAHATVVTGWDSTPRSGRRGLVLAGYNKETFSKAAKSAYELEMKNERPLLFVKSWNEWAEGNMLEPQFNETWSAAESLKKVLCNV